MFRLFLILSFLSAVSQSAWAQEKVLDPNALADSLLQDRTGNGIIEITAFGDSLTRGKGDFTARDEQVFSSFEPADGQEAGYPLRIETLLGIGVANEGRGGEQAFEQGVSRFAQVVPSQHPDIVIISEGSNDARDPLPSGAVFRSIQTMINIAQASGATPVLWTIPPACCGHLFLTPSTSAYNNEISALAVINEIPIADVARAYSNTCGTIDCFLLNRPEGLHPNVEGYDVIGEMIAATLLKIDLLAPDGAAKLEAALQLPAGSIKTKPSTPPT